MEVSEEVAVGNIVEGKVSGITNFGAFVKLPQGKEGLVHISEIAHEFVSDINNFLKIGENIKVKVLSESKPGKYDLSIKQTQQSPAKKQPIRNIIPRSKDMTFEDKIGEFLKRSEEKQTDLRRNIKLKQGKKKKKKF